MSINLQHYKLFKKAFTLAEVLITLGVIGVVAAITLPTLIQNYKKHVVETRLSKFYTTINQAIQMSETVNGDKKYWDALGSGFEKDEDNNPDYTKPEALAWFEKYLKPYIKYAKVQVDNSGDIIGRVYLYFTDGSVVAISGVGWAFYPDAQKFQQVVDKTKSGIEYFTFFFKPACTQNPCKYHYNMGVEPYAHDWDGTLDGPRGLKTDSTYGCQEENPPSGRAFCTKIIQLNGWKIPKDYPLKF